MPRKSKRKGGREKIIQLLGQKKKKVYLKYSKIGDWEKIRDEKTRERAGLGSGTALSQPRRRG